MEIQLKKHKILPPVGNATEKYKILSPVGNPIEKYKILTPKFKTLWIKISN